MPAQHSVELPQLIGNSDLMQQLYKMIGRISNTDCAVLLIGEHGAGKSTVARALHSYGPRASQPFRAISGKQVREASDEELLGIDEEHQNDGTFYISDLTAMPGFAQSRLVEIHRTREYKCLHTGKKRAHNLRFIVATEGDIKEGIESGRMPADLFYDWNFLPLFVPALRDRKEDIPDLANHFLDVLSAEMRLSRRELSPEAREIVVAYGWPGNLSELKNCMRIALQRCRGNYIRSEHLPELNAGGNTEAFTQLEIFLSSRLTNYIENAPSGLSGNLFRLLLPEMEQALFRHALKKSSGNRNRAAQYLGLHRNTLNKKLQNQR